MTKTGIFLAILFLLSFHSKAQNKDSLIQVIPTVKDEKERIRLIYLILGDSGDSDPERALYYYKKLLGLAQKLDDKVAESVVTAEMGYAIYSMGNTVQGTEMLLESCRMAEKTGNQQAIGIAYDNLTFPYLNDPPKRRALLDKALAASTAANDYQFMCWEYANISGIFSDQKQWDSAMFYRQRSLELALSHKVEETIPGALVGVGTLYYQRGQKELGLEHMYAASREPYIKKDAKAAVKVYGTLCTYYLTEKKYDSALYYALRAHDATKNSFYRIQMGALDFVWSAYEKYNEPDSALKYIKQYYAMKDSMSSDMKVQLIQTQLLTEEEKKQTADKEHKSNLQYAAIALGVIVLLILVFVFSHSIIANERLIRFLGILSLLIVFEFLNLLLHPYLETITHHQPLLMLTIMVGIAALLIPLHHKLEHWITHRLVEKSNSIRLAAAKKTIAQLERTGEHI